MIILFPFLYFQNYVVNRKQKIKDWQCKQKSVRKKKQEIGANA